MRACGVGWSSSGLVHHQDGRSPSLVRCIQIAFAESFGRSEFPRRLLRSGSPAGAASELRGTALPERVRIWADVYPQGIVHRSRTGGPEPIAGSGAGGDRARVVTWEIPLKPRTVGVSRPRQ